MYKIDKQNNNINKIPEKTFMTLALRKGKIFRSGLQKILNVWEKNF